MALSAFGVFDKFLDRFREHVDKEITKVLTQKVANYAFSGFHSGGAVTGRLDSVTSEYVWPKPKLLSEDQKLLAQEHDRTVMPELMVTGAYSMLNQVTWSGLDMGESVIVKAGDTIAVDFDTPVSLGVGDTLIVRRGESIL